MTRPKYEFTKYLLATPFEPSLNMGGNLTAEIFFDELYVGDVDEKSSIRTQELIGEVERILVNDEFGDIKQSLFLDGYKGVGKTSFLKYLQRRNTLWNFTFLDFIRNDKKDTGITDPFKSHTLYHLKAVNPTITDFKQFISIKKLSLARHFPNSSNDLINFNPNNTDSYYRILDNAESKDAFEFLLIFLARKKIVRELKGEEKYTHDFIVLDNLDAIDLANITSLVKDDFTQIIDSFQNILQDESIFSKEENDYIDFDNTFRFILCLRDSNKALINPHRRDRLRTNAESLTMNNFESSLYDDALQKRLDYYLKDYGNQYSREVGQLVEIIRDLSDQNFFKSIICPLYNWDFREIAGIYRILKELIKKEEEIDNKLPKLFQTKNKKLSKHGVYGKFGAIFFQIIKVLRNEDFLKAYPFEETNRTELEKNGYCVPLRVILTVLLNMSRVSKVSDILEDGKACEDVTIIALYNQVKDVINLDDFSNTVSDMFNFHRRSWGHLITCRKDSIENPSEVKKIVEDNNHDVKIALNPAGFVSLRSVFTHFEFYSVLFNISEIPLFFAGLQKNGDKYRFESIIENVFARAKVHCKYMKIFYEKTFEEKLKMDGEKYLMSKFAFKHFLFSKDTQNQKGLFHATRLATYHISYIDNFRRWVIENSNESSSVLNTVNTKLISLIQKYRNLLDEWDGLQEYKSEIDSNIIKATDDIHLSISPQNTNVKNE